MSLDLDKSMEPFFDSIGMIVDRTVSPEKILGQACLISQNKVLACASAVFKYLESPWALAVNFPHPELAYGVKSISLHPTFNTTEAHWSYLSQTGSPQDHPYLPENDIAILDVETRLRPTDPHLVSQLNMNLAIQLPVSDMDVSAGMRGDDIPAIIKKALAGGKDGLLTLVDPRNIPLARIEIIQGNIKRVLFKQLTSEVALFELIWRKPAGAFLFQTTSNFAWPNVRAISASSDSILGEAIIRAEQLLPMLHQLGGPEARYQRLVAQLDPNLVSQNLRWVAERLWACLDGYLSIDKLPERVGADAYSIVQTMQEMVNHQLIDIYRKSPFSRSGEIGKPLVPTVDINTEVWDPLDSIFLDPLSGKPITQHGNFFGPSRLYDTQMLLHTVPIPAWGYGAFIIQDGHLIGLHTGQFIPKAGHTPLPQKLYRMVWVNAIQDIEYQRQDMALAASGESGILESEEGSDFKGRSTHPRATAVASEPPLKVGRYICANCLKENVQLGICRNCGVDMEEAALGIDPQEKADQARRLRSSQTPILKIHPAYMLLALAVVLGVAIIFFATGGLRVGKLVSPSSVEKTEQGMQKMQHPEPGR